MNFLHGCLRFVLVLAIQVGTNQASPEEEKEKAALEKFKASVMPKIPVTSHIQNYVNDDSYFRKWLKAKSFDVTAAEHMFLNHLKWREEHHIDSIHTEDFSEMQKECPMYFGTRDKTGRPTTEVMFSDCNMRDVIMSGRLTLFDRWYFHAVEMNAREIYAARASGHNITQANWLMDYGGFSSVQHLCISCLQWYTTIMNTITNHYCGNYNHVYGIDAPPSVETAMAVIRPLLSPSAKDVFKFYTVKAAWMTEFDALFDKEQRGTRFGGTMVREEN